jgi:hypothetical protein
LAGLHGAYSVISVRSFLMIKIAVDLAMFLSRYSDPHK